MIGFNAYQSTPTTLDLNGPILSYSGAGTTQPVGLTTASSTINLVGIATALPAGTGDIAYQWYEVGYGPISSGSSITGTATTTLTLNELNYNDSGREFYLEASYTPSAYQSSSPVTISGRLLDTDLRTAAGIGTTVFYLSSLVGIVTVGDQLTIDTNSGVAVTSAPIVSISLGSTSVEVGSGYTSSSAIGIGSTATIIRVGTARSTGNAINAPLVSDTVEIQVGPTITILQQPSNITIATGNNAQFSVLASIGSSTGAGTPAPCIAVIDESDGVDQTIINSDWDSFRSTWPNRTFRIFQVRRQDGGFSGLKLPTSTNYPVNYNINQIDRDARSVSNWFNAANLGDYVAGTTVTIWIDSTGSMTVADVQQQYDLFLADCAAAGINVEFADSSLNSDNGIDGERYIWPFITNLIGGSLSQDPNLVYQWKVDGENPVDSTTRTVTGGDTRILNINERTAGIHTVACSISYPGAVNSPLLSNVVNYDVVGADVGRRILHVEEYDVNAALYSTQIVNLEDEDLEINPSEVLEPTGDWNRIYSIYAPEEDVAVKVTLAAAAGQTVTGDANPGGQPNIQTIGGGFGGLSSFELTLTQGQEYVVNIGAAIWPSGGNAVNNGGYGGGGSFFYQGGELLVACGGGGGASSPIFHAGALDGMGAGVGDEPVLGPIGSFPGDQSTANTSEREPGQVASCTIGDFWATQGIAPCASIGSTTFFTGKDGQKSASTFTTPVVRGYKAGLNYQFNGGNGIGGGGGGGGGARGGRGGNNTQPYQASGGLGYDGIGNAVAQIPGNLKTVGYIKIEKV